MPAAPGWRRTVMNRGERAATLVGSHEREHDAARGTDEHDHPRR